MCPWCGEPVLPNDPADEIYTASPLGPGTTQSWHRECAARSVLGSVGHQQRRCSCYGGSEEDPPEMTRREAARASLAIAMARDRRAARFMDILDSLPALVDDMAQRTRN